MGAGRNQKKRDIDVGLWEDMDGNAHIDVPALLAMVDMPHTPENIEVVMQIAEKALRKKCPDAKVIRRLTPEDGE